MITCKECIYWNINKFVPACIDIIDYYKNCDLDGNKFLYNPEIKDSKPDTLMYWDQEGYESAGFRTGPDFGCIHGKKKD